MTEGSRLRRHVEELTTSARHRAVPGSMDRAREYTRAVFETNGWAVDEFHHRSGPSLLRTSDYGRKWWPLGAGGPIEGQSLIASRGDTHGAVWVMAHLDSVYCSAGADDNASGVAVILELARLYRGRGIALVLTDNEEAGCLGAKHLARAANLPGLVINLESVGYFSDQPNTQQLTPALGLGQRTLTNEIKSSEQRGDFLLVVHRPTSTEPARLWQQRADEVGLRVLTLEDRRWNGKGQAFTARLNPVGMTLDRSDHAPFWRAQVPSIVLTDTAFLRNPNYHRTTDTPDTLDYARMAQLSESMLRALTEITRLRDRAD